MSPWDESPEQGAKGSHFIFFFYFYIFYITKTYSLLGVLIQSLVVNTGGGGVETKNLRMLALKVCKAPQQCQGIESVP